MEHYNEQGKVLCQICKNPYKIISPTHLKRSHDITLEEYRKKFPDAPITSKEFDAINKYKDNGPFKPSAKVKVVDDLLKELVDEKEQDINPIIDDLIQDAAKMNDDIVVEVEKPSIFKDKDNLYNYIKSKLPYVKNNYIIQELDNMGRIVLRMVTDIADPVNKIDFEFPKAYWHNEMSPRPMNRTEKMEAFGWKIITFNSIPNKDELDKILSHLL